MSDTSAPAPTGGRRKRRLSRRQKVAAGAGAVVLAAAVGVGIVVNRAPAPVPAAVKIAAVGDMVCDRERSNVTATLCQQKATSDLVVNGGYDAFLALGDNQYECASLFDFQKMYAPTFGRVKSITRPVPGNHEYWAGAGLQGDGPTDQCDNAATGYFNYFGAAAHGPSGIYTYELGSWFVLAMNSECSYGAKNVPTCAAENTWLGQQLDSWNAAHPGVSCVLAYWHKPPFTIGTHPGEASITRPFFNTLANKGGDVVLTGHEHYYARYKPMNAAGTVTANGVLHITAGMGGKNHSAFNSTDARVAAKNNTAFGILQMTLGAGNYSWKFVPAAGSTYADAGSGTCH